MNEKELSTVDPKTELPRYEISGPTTAPVTKFTKGKKIAAAAALIYLSAFVYFFNPLKAGAMQLPSFFHSVHDRFSHDHHAHGAHGRGRHHGNKEHSSPHPSFDPIEGPFYRPNQRLRSNITDDRQGLPILLQIVAIDETTSLPLENFAVDLWQADADGVYSGVSRRHGRHHADGEAPREGRSRQRGPPHGPPHGRPPHDGPPPPGPPHHGPPPPHSRPPHHGPPHDGPPPPDCRRPEPPHGGQPPKGGKKHGPPKDGKHGKHEKHGKHGKHDKHDKHGKHGKHNETEFDFDVLRDVGNLEKADFLRGVQQTDSTGVVQFATIFPGTYRGRAAHVNYKIHAPMALPESSSRYENEASTVLMTGQLYFPDELVARVLQLPAYAQSRSLHALEHDRLYDGSGLVSEIQSINGLDLQSGLLAKVTIKVDASEYIKLDDDDEDDFTDSDVETLTG